MSRSNDRIRDGEVGWVEVDQVIRVRTSLHIMGVTDGADAADTR